MKISNSKKELARIIRENGGWRYGADTCSCDQDGYVNFFVGNPTRSGVLWLDNGDCEYIGGTITQKYGKIKNWHQTILSRDDYFHLYPAPDADGWIEWWGGECPVEFGALIDVKYRDGYIQLGCRAKNRCNAELYATTHWGSSGGQGDIIAYRLHKPEQETEAEKLSHEAVLAAKNSLMSDSIEELSRKPAIEQLAADYRNAKDYAERKQQEADAERADADAKLAELVAAGAAIGLVLGIAPVGQELVITDWRDLQVGDIIQCVGSWEKEKTDGMQLPVTALEGDYYEGRLPIRVEVPGVSCPGTWGSDFKFIRRP